MTTATYTIVFFDDDTEEYGVTFTAGALTETIRVPAILEDDGAVNQVSTTKYIEDSIKNIIFEPAQVTATGTASLVGGTGSVSTDEDSV